LTFCLCTQVTVVRVIDTGHIFIPKISNSRLPLDKVYFS
jgi:hypothetical protein